MSLYYACAWRNDRDDNRQTSMTSFRSAANTTHCVQGQWRSVRGMDWWDDRHHIWVRRAGAGCLRGGERLRTVLSSRGMGGEWGHPRCTQKGQPLHNCVGLSECQLSLPPHSAYYYIQTQHGEGEVGISESVAAAAGTLAPCKVLCWLPLIAEKHSLPTVLC